MNTQRETDMGARRKSCQQSPSACMPGEGPGAPCCKAGAEAGGEGGRSGGTKEPSVNQRTKREGSGGWTNRAVTWE